MDGGALAALGLAANILQFIDWVSHVLDIGSQIRRNGMSDFQIGLEKTAKELRHHVARIKTPPGLAACPSQNDQCLEAIAKECIDVANELMGCVYKNLSSSRQISNGRSRIRDGIFTLRKAVALEWDKSKLDALSKKLDTLRRALDSEILLGLRHSIASTAANLDSVGTSVAMHSQGTLNALSEGNRALGKALEENAKQIANGLRTNERTAQERHNEVLNTIDTFRRSLENGDIFPALPESLCHADPSLRSASINGHEIIENEILNDLQFRVMDFREAEIHAHHDHTFDWVYSSSQSDDNTNNLKSWLLDGKGIFWVEGKPGSGKSTLMKMIRTSSKTMRLLSEWAGSNKLDTGAYFFWLAGTMLQKSQEGLLRSLLFQLLQKRRHLISKSFPRLYDYMLTRKFMENEDSSIFFLCEHSGCRESFKQPMQLLAHKQKHKPQTVKLNSFATRVVTEDDEVISENFSLTELKQAFLSIFGNDADSTRTCLFIDGLDEYAGEHQDLVDILEQAVGQSDSLKVIVSSRSETTFVEAFRRCPRIRLQDLTNADISRYVRDQLNSHSEMARMRAYDPTASESLVASVVTKASGVFLWVRLVVRLLLQGLSDGNYPEELESLVEGYPEELRELFDLMIRRMRPEYRVQAERIFQFVLRARSVEGTLPLPLRLVFMEKNDYASSITSKAEPISDMARHQLIQGLAKRLMSRCCGLLELSQGHIVFMHRSVSEFLREPGLLENTILDHQADKFDPSEALLSSMLWHMKVSKITRTELKKFLKTIGFFLTHLQAHQSLNGTKILNYFNEMDRILEAWWKKYDLRAAYNLETPNTGWAECALRMLGLKTNLDMENDLDAKISLAARYGIFSYVSQQLDCLGGPLVQRVGRSLIVRVIYWSLASQSEDLPQGYVDVILEFFKRGYDVNSDGVAKISFWERSPWEKSPWEILVRYPPHRERLFCHSFPKVKSFTIVDHPALPFHCQIDVWASIVVAFIKSGVELGTRLGTSSGPSARSIILGYLSDCINSPEQDNSHVNQSIVKSRLKVEDAIAEVDFRKGQGIQSTDFLDRPQEEPLEIRRDAEEKCSSIKGGKKRSSRFSSPKEQINHSMSSEIQPKIEVGRQRMEHAHTRASDSALLREEHKSTDLEHWNAHDVQSGGQRRYRPVTVDQFSGSENLETHQNAGGICDSPKLHVNLALHDGLQDLSTKSKNTLFVPTKTQKSKSRSKASTSSISVLRIVSPSSPMSAPEPRRSNESNRLNLAPKSKPSSASQKLLLNSYSSALKKIPSSLSQPPGMGTVSMVPNYNTTIVSAVPSKAIISAADMTSPTQDASSMGSFEFGGGVFTWILDSVTPSGQNPTLNPEQQARLQHFVSTLDTSKGSFQKVSKRAANLDLA